MSGTAITINAMMQNYLGCLERLHGGHASGRDLNYTMYYETRRTHDGITFEVVTHKPKSDDVDVSTLPEDYIRFISDEELEAADAPFRNDKKKTL